jgi:hypothetical protein
MANRLVNWFRRFFWIYDCQRCRDTGWISGEVWEGAKGYRVTIRCPNCSLGGQHG